MLRCLSRIYIHKLFLTPNSEYVTPNNVIRDTSYPVIRRGRLRGELPARIRLRRWRASYELRATNYELRITSYELRITSYELRITNYPTSGDLPEGDKLNHSANKSRARGRAAVVPSPPSSTMTVITTVGLSY